MQSWWWDSFDDLGSALVSAAVFYVVLIAATRVSGLRAFSKMSGFDFPLTIAVGSLVASTVLLPDPPLVRATAILFAILLFQGSVAWLRSRFAVVRRWVDNEPLALVREGRLLRQNMVKARISPSELREKLRDANVSDLEKIYAVVMETTGDVTVLKRSEDGVPDPWLMKDVRGWSDAAADGTPLGRF